MVQGEYFKPSFQVPKALPSTGSQLGGSLVVTTKLPTKSLSQVEMDERWKKGLCFWCSSKYTPGNRCNKR